MKCVRCSKPLQSPAVAIRKGTTVFGYGPKCARMAGLIEAIARAQPQTKVAGRNDQNQMQLELEAQA